jgi:chromate transporter
MSVAPTRETITESIVGRESTSLATIAAFDTNMVRVAAATAGSVVAGVGLWPLFAFFLKVGSVLFGSGYVLFAFLRADLVTRWGWLTETQLLDAIAIGQVTPGPLFTTATFVGYLLAGVPGALVATLGIFVPAFVFVAASAPLLPHLRRSRIARGMLDGVNAASLALMAVVTWHLARTAMLDAPSIVLAVTSAVLLLRFHIRIMWLLLAAAALGLASPYLSRLFGGA